MVDFVYNKQSCKREPDYYKIICKQKHRSKMGLSGLHLTRLKPMSLRPDRPALRLVPYKAGRALDEVIAEMKSTLQTRPLRHGQGIAKSNAPSNTETSRSQAPIFLFDTNAVAIFPMHDTTLLLYCVDMKNSKK